MVGNFQHNSNRVVGMSDPLEELNGVNKRALDATVNSLVEDMSTENKLTR